MSSKYTPHYADGKGSILEVPGRGILQAYGDSVPTAGTAGYLPGCLFHDITNGILYTNVGTVTSSLFLAFGGDGFVSLTGSTTLTRQAHANRKIYVSSTSATTLTLPAATGTGDVYDIITGDVNVNNYVINASTNGADFFGNIWTNSTGDLPDLGQPWPTAAGNNTITLNGTTTGGAAVGETITITDVAANVYAVIGFTTSSGVEATPFSTV